MTADAARLSPDPQKRKRPFGVNAIISLSILSVLFSVGVAAVLLFGAAAAVPSLASLEVERWLMIFLIGGSVVQIAGVIGLWRLKRWGWFLIMIHTGAGMFLNIWAYFYAQPSYLAMLVSVLIVLYLNQRDVQQAFIQQPQETPAG